MCNAYTYTHVCVHTQYVYMCIYNNKYVQNLPHPGITAEYISIPGYSRLFRW